MKVLDLYNTVFDDHGNVKACGRDACKKLISACQKENPMIDFGNLETGMMNISNIQRLIKTIRQ
jgi:hypothetical protein